MKRIINTITLTFLLFMLVGVGGCILESMVIEIVLTDQTCPPDFEENHTSENFVTPRVVDYAEEINRILEDNDMSRSDIVSAKVVSAFYEVTDFTHTHDWEISGYISVERTDIAEGPDTIINYTNQSVLGALGTPVSAKLNRSGVLLLNRALQDFIDGADPILRFTVNNGNVEPDPNITDPIIFDWRGCVTIQVITEQEVERPVVF